MYTPIYIPTTAPTRKMSPAPSLTPTAPAALEPTGATALAPTAADGVSVDYNVSVPSISEAEAVEAVVETTTPADVDEAVETAATEVQAETGTTITLVESIATEEISAVEIAADPPGTPGDDGDDPPTLGLSEADDGASGDGGDGGGGGGGGGGPNAAAMGGGVAAGALVLLLAAGALYFYRGSTAAKKPADVDEPGDAELGDVKATLVDAPPPPPPGLLSRISSRLAGGAPARLTEETPDGVAAWLRRQDLPGDVEGLCAAVVDKGVTGADFAADVDEDYLKELGVATLGLRKAVVRAVREERLAKR